MTQNLRTLTVPELISANTPARRAEAQFRLDNWNMSPTNVARLGAFVAPAKPITRKAQAQKVTAPAAKRQADPAKKLAWEITARKLGKRAFGPTGGPTPAFWAEYRTQKAAILAGA